MSQQQINLLNPQLLTARVAFSAKTIAWTLLAGTLFALALYAAAEYQASDSRQQLDRAQAQRDELQAKIDALALHPDQAQAEEDKLAQAVVQETKRIDRLNKLNSALGGRLGSVSYSARLRAFAHRGLPEVWLTAIEFGEQGFRLEGRTLRTARIPDYLALLSREPALKDLPLAGFSISRPDKGDQAGAPGLKFSVDSARAAK